MYYELRIMNRFLIFILASLFLLLHSAPMAFAANPSSATYQLRDYGFGAGGTATSSSETYRMSGIAGQLETGQPFSDTYKVGSGLVFMLMANVPPAPTFTNPATNYDRLKVVVNVGGNPTDATYAIAISTDNFATDIKYVKSDFTIGNTLTASDFKDYSTGWNGTSGRFITSLLSNTAYYIKAKARTGNFSESSWGPVTSVATSNPSLSFGLDTSSITFTNLNAGNSFTDSSKQTTLTTSTNAYNGYIVYAKETQPLTGPTTISDYSSNNGTPTAWSGTGFGYSSTDSVLTGGTPDRFTTGGPKYAGFSTAIQDPVADHSTPIQDPTLTNESFDILYKVVAPSTIEAGQYTNTIIYTVVPTY